jgi:G patch domain-containing protein 1
MASRFTSSSSLPQSQHKDADTASAESLLSKPMGKPENPAESAAKLGMFGPMTRSVASFHPTRLLCKRFNVPVPEESAPTAFDQGPDTTSGSAVLRSFTSAAVQRDDLLLSERSQEDKLDPGSQLEVVQQQPGAPSISAPMDPERNEALEQERPGEAVFKAIFGSDDEDD